ncbi:MAG: alanine racemase [Patescibacteria group bacterium]
MSASRLQINKQSLLHNLQQFKNIAPHSQFWPVVKSNAYGHGLKEVVSILNYAEDCRGFLVVNFDEALQVRVLTKKPIMVLSYFVADPEPVRVAIAKNIYLPIYDLATAQYLQAQASLLGQTLTVNIKIDTGTSRLGVRLEEAEELINFVLQQANLKLFSIYSHLAESESEDLHFSKEQVRALADLAKNFPQVKRHIACSAAAVSLREAQMDIIRLGLSLYGLWPSEPTRKRGQDLGIDLRPVLAWTTKIIQLKKIRAGESVGYNRTWFCEQDCQLAVLPVGYYEGYSRLLSNHGQVLIRDKRYPVRGNICMNLMMVEVPIDLDLTLGEEVVLLGGFGKDRISAEELAVWAQTINYEIVARLNQNIERIII